MKAVLAGCGAITEMYYAPALSTLSEIETVLLMDPSEGRRQAVAARIHSCGSVSDLTSAAERGAELAIVASPSAYHAGQAIEAMESGMHVLCEKPMAATVSEAERMIEVAQRTRKVLAVGLFRRFFPSTVAIREIIENGSLGRPIRYSFAEGGPFGWPAASATFFQKKHAHGGVLHDLGVHTLDLSLHWFGDPKSFEYQDDAAGGLETNAVVRLEYASGLAGEVRLSRDWATSNRYHIEFELGWVGWRVGAANEIEMGFSGQSSPFLVQLRRPSEHWGLPSVGEGQLTYHQSFTAQLAQFLKAVRGEEDVAVPGEEGVRSLRLIEACYEGRA